MKKEINSRVGNLTDSLSWMGFDLQEITEYQELVGLFDLIDLLIGLDVQTLLKLRESYSLISKACFDILAISGNFPDVS